MSANRPSRLPGFYKLSLDERQRLAARTMGITLRELKHALAGGGLDPLTADKTVENVIGTYALPFALGLNVQMNGEDHLAPMVIEEPSVVAAASNAAKLVRSGGGFTAEADPPHMVAQIQLDDVPDADRAREAIEGAREELLRAAAQAIPGLVGRGGGPRDLSIRDLGGGMISSTH